MKRIKIFLLIVILPLMAFSGFHKYYISVTQVDYIQEKRSVQITTRIFIDDFENILRERYNENIVLAGKEETKEVNKYIETYLRNKIRVRINDKDMSLIFIGKEYDVDIIQCYIEIQNVTQVKSIEITNEVLFDLFEDQQNMIKTKINSKQKSFLLNQNNKTAVLNFN
ncbi:DUF6702 family protein [Gaetbulibacter aquiaggeris]|uniref:DUF6702 family protein n=1 Tax=Gaetbulibacter aquiaggeris TaxID=1735373 RepID=A0ABW7MMX9_9FLAO